MSDFEIDRECLSDHQTLLHSPSAHATTAAAATDIPNANGSPWPTRGTNPSTGVDFSQRDAQALRGESTFCQPHAIYGGEWVQGPSNSCIPTLMRPFFRLPTCPMLRRFDFLSASGPLRRNGVSSLQLQVLYFLFTSHR